MEIIGVDFSGARADSSTWIAEGDFDGSRLTLHRCYAIKRDDLLQKLRQLPADSVASLDFPFSVPADFAAFWSPQSLEMPDLWHAASRIDLAQFIQHRNDFVERNGESKRACDLLYPESYSCLHMGRPNMVPMTFHGMQMLHQLWQAGCRVPPLRSPENPQRQGATLLESMPGAVLRALGLPFKGYKGGSRAHELRRAILSGLPERVPFVVAGLDELDDVCMSIDDALDATVACICAALWVAQPARFRLPASEGLRDQDASVKLEGWLYAPFKTETTGDGGNKP